MIFLFLKKMIINNLDHGLVYKPVISFHFKMVTLLNKIIFMQNADKQVDPQTKPFNPHRLITTWIKNLPTQACAALWAM